MVSVMGFATCSVFLLFFFVFHLFFLINPAVSTCANSFNCGDLGPLEYPLTNYGKPECGLISVNCIAVPPKIQLGPEGVWYEVHQKISTNKFNVRDTSFPNQLKDRINCSFIGNRSLPQSPLTSFSISPILKMFSCTKFLDHDRSQKVAEYFKDYKNYSGCNLSTLYYKDPPEPDDSSPSEESKPSSCSIVEMPVKLKPSPDFFEMFSADFELEWNISDRCVYCHNRGKKCVINYKNYKAQCQESNSKKVAILASSVIVGSVVLLGICILFILYRRKKRNSGAYLLSRNISSDPSSKTDMEGGNFYFGIPIFSYKELEKATNHFDSSRELGDGGFGTVYYGKLRDGREVAIKRLYEHNCRRVEQFLNEIKILTCLRHPNLVSLYGCTSRKSRDLLLVYEYIANGTVADHLHGERAKEAPLTWPVRMSIAIETASALAYLHKSDIIHRDVKTNNILLDSSFCVKVADFGLSRLFPNDVTHISTAPQGTPGYVDPEYHQCYQLTDKSDVYSFGVVLIELISSMPAVDITRHRHEINLANLAVNRIQRCEFDELIDQSLGYDSDAEVTRMTTSVAELAFRCLQLEKDMRPSMDEVLAFLKDIQEGGDCKFENAEGVNGNYGVRGKIIPPSPETDDVVLLKNKHFESSPVAVTDAWVSSSSTTTSSIG